VDLAQVRGYGLGEPVEKLLYALALYKIRSLLDNPFRPRTACDLELFETKDTPAISIKQPNGFELPKLSEIKTALPSLIKACADKFANPTTTTVTFE
jgi:CRISPR-associated protein Csb1